MKQVSFSKEVLSLCSHRRILRFPAQALEEFDWSCDF